MGLGGLVVAGGGAALGKRPAKSSFVALGSSAPERPGFAVHALWRPVRVSAML